MATAQTRKTIRDLIFKNKKHKDFQESQKINFANKGILKLTSFYTISSILMIAYRDWQYRRNLDKLLSENNWEKIPLVQQLREKTMFENLVIVILSIIVSFIILYYYNKKMNDVNENENK